MASVSGPLHVGTVSKENSGHESSVKFVSLPPSLHNSAQFESLTAFSSGASTFSTYADY